MIWFHFSLSTLSLRDKYLPPWPSQGSHHFLGLQACQTEENKEKKTNKMQELLTQFNITLATCTSHQDEDS